MGVVYQVIHSQTGKQFALKVLSIQGATKPETLSRFKREIRMPSHIGSEFVVKVFESDIAEELDGAPFYVMELLHGCDVRRLLERKFAMSQTDIVWLCRQVADCLDAAHKVGIVHRDLKPDNIFLHQLSTGGLVTKILDFGIARINQELLESKDRANLTATQAMVGTPLYMSPEQAMGGEGRQLIGPATDVWALGLIVFELLSGRSYWAADSLLQHLGQLMFAPMVPASQRAEKLPAGFDDWFARACARASKDRFQSVGEQVQALTRILSAGTAQRASLTLVNAVGLEAPPLIDHSEPTFSDRIDVLQRADPQSGLQSVEIEKQGLSTLEESSEGETVRFRRLGPEMLPNVTPMRLEPNSGVPVALVDNSDTVPTPAPPTSRRSLPPGVGAGAKTIQPAMMAPNAPRKSIPPAGASDSAPVAPVEPMATVPYQSPPTRRSTPSMPHSLVGTADQEVKAELLENVPTNGPGVQLTSPIGLKQLALVGGALALIVLLVALLSSSSTTPVSQPNDMALPVRDLSTPPDLSVLDLALPSPTGKKTGKKSLPQGQSPPKKDKSSLKYYVPQNL
ncbi:MAG: protein kinase [Myxococcales bacterium]|nr:protein kinase [Myxococcales bacterium]